jgi:PAS domain S-box-containing protein
VSKAEPEREREESSPLRRRIKEAADALQRAAAELARHDPADASPAAPDERYRLILESATDYGIISMDAERRITAWNVGACNVLGWSEAEALGAPADMIFTPEDIAQGAPDVEAATADREGRANDERWHVRKDGSRFWAAGILTPMREGGGYLKILRDRTAAREAEQRQNLLLAELQHRVRNMLAVVRSVAARTVETSATLEDFASHFDGRLSTLARTQNILTRRGDSTVDLEELVRDELVSVAAGDNGRAQVKGPPVSLRQGAAEIFALALHELATNAVKYGALAHPKGKLSVEWRVFDNGDGQRLSLEWRERGVPAVDAANDRTGFGRILIEQGLPYELGAATALEFARGGVRAVIELPLTEKTAVAPESAA